MSSFNWKNCIIVRARVCVHMCVCVRVCVRMHSGLFSYT